MKYPLTPSARDKAARALAEATNGGLWDRDYTEGQRDLWRQRVDAAMGVAR